MFVMVQSGGGSLKVLHCAHVGVVVDGRGLLALQNGVGDPLS